MVVKLQPMNTEDMWDKIQVIDDPTFLLKTIKNLLDAIDALQNAIEASSELIEEFETILKR